MHTQPGVGLKYALLLFVAASTSFFASAAHAIPAYARQTGMACSACHFQKYPALNQFGREFKASGFTLTGKQGVVEGEQLSLAQSLNASLFTQIRYQKTNGSEDRSTDPNKRTTNSGELQFPDEFALLIGGRAADNIGFFFEGQLANSDDPFMANFKMPFVYELGPVRLSAIPFTTDELGAPFGFEVLNTGAVHNLKASEHGEATSAQQYIGTATRAEGIAMVVYNPLYHLNVTKWSPNHVATANDHGNGSPTSTYVRGAVTPAWGAWDIGLGFQLWSGGSRGDGELLDDAQSGLLTDFRTEATAFDAQAQGEVGGLPLGIYLTRAIAKASDANGGPTNLFNAGPRDKTATTITAELGVVPNRLTALIGFRKGDTGDEDHSEDNAFTVGANFKIRQNIILHLVYSKFSGNHYDSDQAAMQPGGTGNALTTFMLSAGF